VTQEKCEWDKEYGALCISIIRPVSTGSIVSTRQTVLAESQMSTPRIRLVLRKDQAGMVSVRQVRGLPKQQFAEIENTKDHSETEGQLRGVEQGREAGSS
jgi:hypothetical protein